MQRHLHEDQFSEQHDFPANTPIEKTLVVASTPRCGSHMLGYQLYETGAFGFPLEYANHRNLRKWKQRFEEEDTRAIFQNLKALRTSPNGVFSMKLHYSHLDVVGGIDQVLKDFPNPHFVILTRNNHLKQAVSYSIARQTGVWFAGMQATTTDPQYDFEDIDHCLRETLRDNAAWRYVLASRGCRYIHMSFEEVRSDPHAAIQRVADFMGVEVSPDQFPAQEATEKQSNTLNKEWLERYLQDCQSGSELFPSTDPGIAQRVKRKLVGVMKAG
ncbi:Stf0 family sulfotransferase [Marinobacter lacisalsi]|uniref:Stf0 family sulfotransferase n=1 Tax=Marinobacter lacisalsi TaxID=475979 RepID=A0ABV8QG33_9GAMM